MRIKDGRKMYLNLPRNVSDGIDKLARLEQRTARDYIRLKLKEHVDEELAKGTISPGPLKLDTEEGEDE